MTDDVTSGPGQRPAHDPLKILGLLRGWLVRPVNPDTLSWMASEIESQQAAPDERRLGVALGLAGRKLRRVELTLSPDQLAAAQSACPGWQPQFWAADEMMRAALLLASYRNDDASFAVQFEKLCLTAEITEHVSYMKGLAIFPAGDRLFGRAREGVRSSIGPVFRAVACHNPYPRNYFDVDAWNQMIVKCVFDGVPIADVVGADERRNPELLIMLRDLVSERHAAGRPLPQAVHRFIEG